MLFSFKASALGILVLLGVFLCSATAQQPSASLSGTIVDRNGSPVANARITLKIAGSEAKTLADANGRFAFIPVQTGAFTLTVAADGFITEISSGAVQPATAQQLPPISLPVAGSNTQVYVTATEHDLAESEVKVEEHQRLLGIVPNFYVTYDYHAAPLSTRQKYDLGYRTVIDPISLLINAGIAGVEQATNSFSGYGQGASGYFKRFGAANADFAVGTMLGGSILPALFHQDPRYFYMGKGTILHRALYAFATAVIARGDDGKWQPSYAGILGDFAAGAISNIYYPPASRQGATLTIENGLLSIASDGAGNVVQEFLLRHLTRHPPIYILPTP